MRILVVEDRKENIELAKKQLSDHDLIITESFDEALLALYSSKGYYAGELEIGLLIEAAKKLGWEYSWQKGFTKDGKSYSTRNLPECLLNAQSRIKSLMTDKPFDIILTDVMLPKGSMTMMRETPELVSAALAEKPYGPMIALRALSLGYERVGIITVGNHHDDPLIYAFDGLRGFTTGNVKVVCSNEYCDFVAIDLVTMEEVKWPGDDDRLVKSGQIVLGKNWKALLDKVINQN